MPRPFHPLTLEEFIDLLGRFPFESPRIIDAVHMHHTWRPNRAQYRGEETIIAMWRFHTEQNRWSDIAQHVTIAPDGTIWTGRDWNQPPASAAGHNGSRMSHPFMFETIGDFDRGKDRFEDPQRQVTLEVIAHVQQRFGLPLESLRFHREMSPKTCPGNGLSQEDILASVRKLREALDTRGRAARRGAEQPRPFADSESATRARVDVALRSFGRAPAPAGRAPEKEDPLDAELLETAMAPDQLETLLGPTGSLSPWPAVADARAPGARAVPTLGPEMLAELRPHVINLNQGRFSAEGVFQTTAADVDAIFDDHLRRRLEAQPAGTKLRVLFFAHGGLVDEAHGLWIAHQQVRWWNANGVYPIFFVWETGFADALKQILGGTRGLVSREVRRDVADVTTDPVIEQTARLLGGGKIWSAMKRSAELAVGDDGGARYAAERLRAFCAAHADAIELHAMGHSAGSIFHAHFLDTAFALGVPAFQSLSLLAPAVRVDTFKQRLRPHVGGAIKKVVMFTMQRDWERADQVAGVYRKSLLYLVSRALEREREAPILGLEVSMRDDRELRALFGLDGAVAPSAEVVWSVTREDAPPRAASTSRTHGGFDNDAATMQSAARRILDRDQIEPFPQEAIERALDIAANPLADLGPAPVTTPAGDGAMAPAAFVPGPMAPTAGSVVTLTPPPAAASGGGGGRRRALCIGIDRYATAPLAGCVADARTWAGALQAVGFESPVTLFDEQATRGNILDALTQLVRSSVAGDVVVFQYAGHGTLLPDLDGDETVGPAAGFDQAICPADFASGAFLIDDDIAAVFRTIPDGVNLTCFIDCCHSGTVTRFAVGLPAGRGMGDRRARFLKADDAMKAAHRRFRTALGMRRAVSAARGPEMMREVLFSACLPSEVAFEANGHGDFTQRAVQVLAGGLGSMTNEEFHRKVTEAFGAAPQQHPDLDCAPAVRTRPLLQPLVAAAGAPTRALGIAGISNGSGAAQHALLAQSLRAIADLLGREAGPQ